MKTTFLLLVIVLAGMTDASPATNLVANGSFESENRRPGVPDFWASAGNPRVRQDLRLDQGRDGRRCARLVCSQFGGDGPDFHAMLCQVGQVTVRRGQWYRLSFWARGQEIETGAVQISLVNTSPWQGAGLAEVFTPGPDWERFEFLFRASQDLPAAASRLQFWFNSTGTMWLDHVELTESAFAQQWFPQYATEGVKNFLPNSSFECGAANWGSYTWGLSGWAGNLYRQEGVVDETVAASGGSSIRISLGPETLPVFYFDYYEPIRQPVRRVLIANQGWFHVTPGEKLTLSAYLRADAEGVVAQLATIGAPDHMQHKPVTVGTSWQRFEFSFAAGEPFLFVAVGLDLEASRRERADLWIDAVQLERGAQATTYEPRSPIESFLESTTPGNSFTNPAAGLTLAVRACNTGSRAARLDGTVQVSDFLDEAVCTNTVSLELPAKSARTLRLTGLCQGRLGYFKAAWAVNHATNSILRCALLEPPRAQLQDSPFGFNHAYPWDFLVQLSHRAGVTWWRDWSAKWQTVEPEHGRWDFAAADAQIRRVLDLRGRVDVLLPFPSARWCSTAQMNEVEKRAGNNSYLKARLPVAYAPKQADDFGSYAAAAARHYGGREPGATTFEILNEPLYTDYALPVAFGYRMEDYLALVKVGSRAIREACPNAVIVGGIGANAAAGLTLDFVRQGGLEMVDVLDIHMYDAARPAESFAKSFRVLAQTMQQTAGIKPIWITEWGCYADDDPASVPSVVGDDTMNRCRWRSERAATEHIVKFTAVSFAWGVRKIFFHAGTCGTINGPDAGGVLFEYGGAPRKMLCGVSALNQLLGVPRECLLKSEQPNRQAAYVFRTAKGATAILWSANSAVAAPLPLAPGITARDIMGNLLPGTSIKPSPTPIYLLSNDPQALVDLLSRN